MNCPRCRTPNAPVADSRQHADRNRRRRRRWCEACGHRFTTWEVAEVHLRALESQDGGARRTLAAVRALIDQLEP